MIKYEGIEKRYYYDKDKISNLIKKIDNIDSFRIDRFEIDDITSIFNDVNNFIDSFEKKGVKNTMERAETEVEAREYFGDRFITKYEMLLDILDKQDVKVALHGTTEGNAKEICNEGLKYKDPAIKSTAVIQSYDECVNNFSELLNWKHREYKNLVIVGIPSVCTNKEGLWEVIGDGNSLYDGFNYKINEDFIVGYLDINNKNIVINPKYSNSHNYEGLEKDIDIYREKVDENVNSNDEVINTVDTLEKKSYVEEVNIDNCEELLEDSIYVTRAYLKGLSNNKNGYINDDFYMQTLNNISNQVIIMNKCISFYSGIVSKNNDNNKREVNAMFDTNFFENSDSNEWIGANESVVGSTKK